jgi:hypothetical protein
MTETTTDETTTNDDEQDQAVAPNVIWGSGQEMFYQAGPVDTLGLAVPTSQPAFAAVKALAFRRAIDDLEGNAPKGSGNVVMDRDLNDPDVRAAVLEDLKAQEAEARAIVEGNIDEGEDGEVSDQSAAALAPPPVPGVEDSSEDQSSSQPRTEPQPGETQAP